MSSYDISYINIFWDSKSCSSVINLKFNYFSIIVIDINITYLNINNNCIKYLLFIDYGSSTRLWIMIHNWTLNY